MKLNEMYLSETTTNQLELILDFYNGTHMDNPLSYQQIAERMLETAIYNEYYEIRHAMAEADAIESELKDRQMRMTPEELEMERSELTKSYARLVQRLKDEGLWEED